MPSHSARHWSGSGEARGTERNSLRAQRPSSVDPSAQKIRLIVQVHPGTALRPGLSSGQSFWARREERTAASSLRLDFSTSGKARFKSLRASRMAAGTTSRVNHLLSAGTTYQGGGLV